jgi:hypothetical protein
MLRWWWAFREWITDGDVSLAVFEVRDDPITATRRLRKGLLARCPRPGSQHDHRWRLVAIAGSTIPATTPMRLCEAFQWVGSSLGRPLAERSSPAGNRVGRAKVSNIKSPAARGSQALHGPSMKRNGDSAVASMPVISGGEIHRTPLSVFGLVRSRHGGAQDHPR